MPTNEETKTSGMSRRGFISTSAAGAAALSTLGSLPHVHAAGSDEIKIALIGCGGRGTGAAGNAIKSNPGVKIWAMADAFEDQLNRSADKLSENKENFAVTDDRKFVGFDAFKNAIDSGVDMVILTTPPGFRPIHFEYAVKANKNVFMEKPVAVDAPGVRSVLESAKLAKEKNLAVAVGLQRHHENQYRETLARLKDGAIGNINYMRAYWNSSGVWVRPREEYKPKTEMEYQMRNWYYFNWLCGDHITEQHIHNLDVINWLKDDFPIRAEAMGGRQVRTGIDHGEIYDHFFVQYDYADGSRLYSQCRHQKNCLNSVSEWAYGDKGYSQISRSIIMGENKWRFEGQRQGGHQQEWHNLMESLRNGEKPMEAEYGAKSTMTSILGRMAAYSGQEIMWEDAINSKLSLAPDKYAWDGNPQPQPDENGRYKIPMPGITKTV
jgi:predicted dehydrogenase